MHGAGVGDTSAVSLWDIQSYADSSSCGSYAAYVRSSICHTLNISDTAELILTEHAAATHPTDAGDILDLSVIGPDEFCFV